MHHSFDITIAEKYGVNVAIFLNNMAFWIKKNQANDKHFHDGRYWTYNSQEALREIFPYWSRQNIRTVLKACERHNLILTGNFNENGYDRTTWYSLTDLGLSLFSCFEKEHSPIGENQPNDLVKSTRSLVRTNQPIPYNNTYIKPDKRERAKKSRAPLPDFFEPDEKRKAILDETAVRVGLMAEALLEKFKSVMQHYGKVSADWQIELEEFMRKEKAPINKTPLKPFTPLHEIRSTVPQVPYNPIKIKVSDKETALQKIAEIKKGLTKKFNANKDNRASIN